MTTKETFDGWTNYETWCVHLWLTNDRGTYGYWRDEARRQRAEAPGCEQVREGIWTPKQAEKFRLGERLKEEFESFCPLKEPDVYTDLLNAALADVNWNEIAAAFLALLGEPDEESTSPAEGSEPGVSGEEAPAGTRSPVARATAPRFPLGRFVATPGVLEALMPFEVRIALSRHSRGDWGDVDAHDRQENERALRDGGRLLSAYHAQDGTRYWVITEADRSATTLLLPQEY